MKTLTASSAATLADPERRWVYNGLDVCATLGAINEMRQIIDADEALSRVYEAERRLCAPALAVQMRGIRVDDKARPWGARCLKKAMLGAQRVVSTLTSNPDLNIASHHQLRDLFYRDLGLAEMRNKKGDVSTDRSVLERIASNQKLEWARSDHAPKEVVQQVAAAILKYRDWAKQREIYTTALYHGRMRCTISVGSTETFRFSSTKSPLGDGRNLQNITKGRRIIFIPDPGFTLYSIDQKQAESLCVAYASGDPAYIEAQHSPDAHTAVARLCAPDLDWPPPGSKEEYEFVRRPNYLRHFSLRDLYKRIQHSINYLGTYHTVSRTLHIPEAEAARQIDRYFAAFPGIPKWQQEVIRQVKEEGIIHYPGGYKRPVLGHRNDPATHRECVASIPQSIIGWINHSAFALIWHELDGSFLPADQGPPLQVLMHVHDAVLFQSRTDDLAHQAHALASTIEWPMPGGDMKVPWDFKSGPNWKAVS